MPSSPTLRQAVGQLLIMGFDGVEPSERLTKLLKSMRPGGVILFARNIEAARQVHSLLRACQKSVPTPLFRCVDMEGGVVDRLKQAVAPAPSAAAVFASGQRKFFRRHGALIGAECSALGFNTDFAPVMDLAFVPSRSVLGSRAVSSQEKSASLYAREFLAGLRAAGIFGCGKHFPGLGEAALDTHKALPSVPKPFKLLWQQDLAPYRALHRQLTFVMVAHCAYPAVSGDSLPASLSAKWIDDILRRKIGYRGLIICDDLEMGGVLAAGSIEHAAVESLRAGADMFLVCQTEENVQRAWEAVLHAAEADPEFARRVRQAAARVAAQKKKLRKLKKFSPPPTQRTIQRLQRALAEFTAELPAA